MSLGSFSFGHLLLGVQPALKNSLLSRLDPLGKLNLPLQVVKNWSYLLG